MVGPVMLPPAALAETLPALAPGDDLREALTQLLRSGAVALPVRNATGDLLGSVSLDVIRRLTQPAAVPALDGRRPQAEA